MSSTLSIFFKAPTIVEVEADGVADWTNRTPLPVESIGKRQWWDDDIALMTELA